MRMFCSQHSEPFLQKGFLPVTSATKMLPSCRNDFFEQKQQMGRGQASVLSMRLAHHIEKTLVLSRKCIIKFAKKHKTHLRLNIQYICYSAVCLLLRKPTAHNYSIYNKTHFFTKTAYKPRRFYTPCHKHPAAF